MTHLSSDRLTTQLYIRNIISHYKDPYEPTSIMECQLDLITAQLDSMMLHDGGGL